MLLNGQPSHGYSDARRHRPFRLGPHLYAVVVRHPVVGVGEVDHLREGVVGLQVDAPDGEDQIPWNGSETLLYSRIFDNTE